MKLLCPNCRTRISASDINVETDLAKCASCHELFKASELVSDIDLSEDLTPPTGSSISFSRDPGQFGCFTIPRGGVKGGDMFVLLFATFWICFIAFWTWGAAQGSILFAAFSLPFWLVGLGMWRGILIGVTESQEFCFQNDTLVIWKKSLVSSKHIEIPYADIGDIEVAPFLPRDPITMTRHMRHFTSMSPAMGGFPLATIEHGTKKTSFAENVSEAEAKWMASILKAMVRKKQRKRNGF